MRRSGFTLVELIMVLCLLVVFSSLTVSGILRWQTRLPLEQAISTTQQQIYETRLEAIRAGVPWILTMPHQTNPGSRKPLHERTSATGLFRLPEGIQCRSGQLKNDANRNEDLSPGQIQLVFQADGTASDSAIILIEPSGHKTSLRLDRLTGNVSVVSAISEN